jgi:hypothetical protein
MMRALPAALAFALLLALPASAVAHTIPGLVRDAREVVTVQASGTHATIAADGVHLELRRAGASVVEVLDLQGLPALKLDARGAWARKGAPILSVLSIATGPPDARDPDWLQAGHGSSLRFHYPGTHGEVVHTWRVPLRVDGRTAVITGAVEPAPRPSLTWAIGAFAAIVAAVGLVVVRRLGRRTARAALAALAAVAIVIPLGESEAATARPTGSIVAAAVACATFGIALRLRRDTALELGALAAGAVLLALPLVGRVAVLRHGVVVTTLAADLERALVSGGLALAAAAIAAAARAWWPA